MAKKNTNIPLGPPSKGDGEGEDNIPLDPPSKGDEAKDGALEASTLGEETVLGLLSDLRARLEVIAEMAMAPRYARPRHGSCARCVCFVPRSGCEEPGEEETWPLLGSCRRNPTRVRKLRTDWCGEFVEAAEENIAAREPVIAGCKAVRDKP